MKKINFIVLMVTLMIFAITGLNAQNQKATDIEGVWLNEDTDAHVEIYKIDGKYFGKIIWLRDPIDEETGKPKKDKNNPDESLQDQLTLGLKILNDFVFDGDDEWEDGTIYDPKNGKTYSCYIKFEDENNLNKLKIRGYIGISWFGRTTYWTRVGE
ncbi:MAG: DUF2147 domain-containing protein [Bacteroidetes bacterium]|nr:DUF2147 domain-containing protein [Bacteroidota bacterium]